MQSVLTQPETNNKYAFVVTGRAGVSLCTSEKFISILLECGANCTEYLELW